MLRYFLAPIALLAAAGLAACATAPPSQDLTQEIWILAELNGSELLAGTTISAQFGEDGMVGGSSGCNSYSTTYEVSGNRLTFSDSVIATAMACENPIMAQEAAFLQVLSATARYQMGDGTLTFLDGDGDALAAFEVQSQELAGTTWVVTGYNDGSNAVVSVIPGTEITANFDSEQLGGIAGCNNYFASFDSDGDSISFDTVGSTEIFCAEPEGIMEQERAYLEALKTAATYKIEGTTLEMRTAEGATAVSFMRAFQQ